MAKFFTINLTNSQKNLFNEIKIEKYIDPFKEYVNKNSKWISFDDDLLIEDIVFNALKYTSSSNSNILCKKISKIISYLIKKSTNKIKKKLGAEQLNRIIWLRFQPPTNKYELERWHTDGQYFSSNEHKIIISLVGDGTLIAKCKNNKKIIEKIKINNRKYPALSYNKKNDKLIFNEENDNKQRKKNKEIISKYCKIRQLKNFEGVLYNVGNHNACNSSACIHSEPNMTKSRIFLAVLVSEKLII